MSKSILFSLIIAATVSLIIFAGFFGSYLSARQIIRPPIGTTLTVPAFAYAPSPYQTDSTPCQTATGHKVRSGTIASNFLPFGTIVRSNAEYYIVEDRMNPRYNRAIDIFFPSSSEALAFGRQTIDITIVAYGQPGQSLPNQELRDPAEQTAAEPDEEFTLFNRWFAGLNYLPDWLKASAAIDVNRHDVNCFIE